MFSTVAHHRLASAPGMIYSCVFCAGVGKQTGKLTDRLYKSFGRAAAELLSSTSSFNSIGNINSSCQCLPGPVLHNIVEETRRRTHTQNLLLYSSRGFGTGFSLSCSSSHLSSCFFFSLSLHIFFFASFSWRRQSLRLGGSSLQPAASFPRLSQSFLHLSSSAVARELDLGAGKCYTSGDI